MGTVRLVCIFLAMGMASARASVFTIGPITTIDTTDGFEPVGLRSADGVVVFAYQPNSENYMVKAWDQAGGLRVVRSTSSSSQAVGGPDVSGRTIVWAEFTSSGIAKIRAENLDTKVVVDVTTPSANQGQPSIENNTVVWTQSSANGKNDVYTADLQSYLIQPVANDPAVFESAPDISNGRVLYANGASVPGIRVRDLASQANTYAYDLPGGTIYSQPRPMIDGNLAAWFESTNQLQGLHVVNVLTSQQWTIGNTERAAISNGIVAYNDYSQGAIMALDTVSGTTTLLRTLPHGGSTSVTLDGYQLSWVEWLGTTNHFAVETALVPEPSSLLSMIAVALLLGRKR